MAVDIGPKIGIDGEAQFRKQLNDVNQSLKTLGSEMKLVTAEFADNAKSEEALTKKNDVLERSVLQLNEKLEMQEKALVAAGREYGEADAKTMKWQQAVNETKAALAQAEKEIDDNTKSMEELGNETDETAKKGSSFGDKFSKGLKVAGKSIEVLAGAAAAAAGAVFALTTDSAEWADDLNTLSKQTGISTEQLQKYQYAAGMMDVSVETITGSMTKLTKSMSNARKGNKGAVEAFEKLGVSVTDANGALRDNEDVFGEAIDALGQIENETERDALAMEIFGKSAQDLNPLILEGAGALEELGKQAEEAGVILSEDSVDKLNTVADAMDTFKATAEGAGRQFSVTFAEPIAAGVDTLTGYLSTLTTAFTEGGFEAIPEAFGTILEDLLAKVNEYLPQVMSFGMEIVITLLSAIISSLPQMAQTGISIITTVVDSLSSALPELIPVAIDAILTLADTLTDPDNLGQMVDSALNLIMALADGLIAALPELAAKAPEIILNLITAISQNLPKILETGVSLVVEIGKGLIKAIPQLVSQIPQIIVAIVQAFLSFGQTIASIGLDIVKGIWSGISNGFNWLKERITEWVGNVLAFFKKLLKISSPSRVFADEIGYNMGLGVAEGWDNSLPAVRRDIDRSMASLLPDATANIGVVSSMRGTGMQSSLADAVNAMGALMGGGSTNGDLAISFVINGREFARGILPDFRLVSAQNPIIVNDF